MTGYTRRPPQGAAFVAGLAGFGFVEGKNLQLDQRGYLRPSHGRYVTFQMAEVAVSRKMFADILSQIARLRAPPAPA